jgi:hypothetical protein
MSPKLQEAIKILKTLPTQLQEAVTDELLALNEHKTSLLTSKQETEVLSILSKPAQYASKARVQKVLTHKY